MTVDIRIGVLIPNPDPEIGGYIVDWPNVQPMADGSKPKYNSTSRQPFRSSSSTGFESWVEYDPAFQKLVELVTDGKTDIDGFYTFRIDAAILYLAKKLRRSYFSQLNADRSRWLQFWLNQAHQTFGNDAWISIS